MDLRVAVAGKTYGVNLQAATFHPDAAPCRAVIHGLALEC